MEENNLGIQVLIICFLLAVCAGFSQGTFADVWACRISVTLMLLPLVIWCLKQNDWIHMSVIVVSVIYIIFLYFINYRDSNLLTQSLKLQFENTLLSNKLAISNKMLEQKVDIRTEQLRFAKEEAEAASRAKTEFLSIATHELKTPFKTINSDFIIIKQLYSKLLNAYVQAKNKLLSEPYITPQQLSRLPYLLKGIESEIAASSNFISMLRSNIDKNEYTDLPNLECSITDCIAIVLERYPFKEAERELVYWDKSKNFTFMGNQILIVHVIFNLLKNAFQSIEEEGEGHIEIWFTITLDKNYLYFKDTAKGIPLDILPHVFDRYYSNSKGGTGLGLAFCQMIMKGLGGKITCNSKLSQYTEFVLEFPTNNLS